jgi:hypothetical protein
MSKPATTAAVDDGNVSVSHAAMVAIDGGIAPINNSNGEVFAETADTEPTREPVVVAVATVVSVAAATIEPAQAMDTNDKRLTVFLFAHDAVQGDGQQPTESQEAVHCGDRRQNECD